jgi:hypothetical protein
VSAQDEPAKPDVWEDLRAAMAELKEAIDERDPPPRPKLTLIQGGRDV